jgi:quinohemoprotein ethanol dehydrogenase
LLVAVAFIAVVVGCASMGEKKGSPEHIKAITGRIDGAAIVANAGATKDWPSHGLDYAETRFSRLTQVNDGNVGKLGRAWTYNLESTRGVEATPIVVDGIMYVTASWSVVHALDVRTGKRLWMYDPKVARATATRAAATSSTAASPSTRARSTSAPTTDA